jgi:hypothetical protein
MADNQDLDSTTDIVAKQLGVSERELKVLYGRARELRHCYAEFRRRATRRGTADGTYKDDTKTWPQAWWVKLLMNLERDQVDPLLFIKAQFERFFPKYPFPNQLMGRSALDFYQHRYGCQQRQERADIVVKWHNDVVQAELQQGLSVLQVLTRPEVPLNPLFSYCLARNEYQDRPNPELATLIERLRPDAQFFLAQNPEFRQTALGRFIPEQELAS